MIKNKIIENFYSYLIIIIPLALITGPFIPDLINAILAIGYLVIKFKEGNLKNFNNFYFKIFLILCLYLIILSFLSSNFYSIKSSVFYFRFGLCALAIGYFITQKPEILKIILYLFLSIYIILFIDSIFQYYFLKNIFGFEYINIQNFRITSFFGEDEVLGSYTVRFFPLILFLVLWNNKRNLDNINVIIIISSLTIITFTIILLSGERTSLGLFCLSFIFIFLSSKKFRKLFIIPLALIILVFGFTISTSEKIKNRIVTQTINQMGLNPGSERMVMFSKTYEGHFTISYNMFKEKPIIGHGPKMFRYYCIKEENFVAPNACTTHPHNFYAQSLAETGIIGFFVLLSIFLTIVFFFIKNLFFQIFKKKQYITDFSICLLSSYFMTLFPLLPSGNFFNNWLSIIMYFPLGFIFYIIRKNKFYV